MRTASILIACSICATLFISNAYAYPEEYGPFESGNIQKSFPLKECVIADGKKAENKPAPSDILLNEKNVTFTKDLGSNVKIQISSSENDSYSISLRVLGPNGAVLGAPKLVAVWPWVGSAYWADLNSDGKDDYVVEVWSGGSGLAEELCNLVFVLSSGGSYRITVVDSFFPGPEDFIDLFNDGRCQVIHTSFVSGEQGRDCKTHNYWVYNLLEIDGDKINISNHLDKRFPKWVMYTFKPNHKETGQLTSKQKDMLWKSRPRKVFWEPQPDTM